MTHSFISTITERVTQLARSKQFQLALTELSPYLQGTQESAPLYDLAAQLTQQLGDLPTASKYAQQATTLDPKNPHYFARFGFILAHLLRPSEAEAALQKSIALLPGQPALLDLLGTLSSKRQNYDQAEDYWIEAIEADPAHTIALCNWAQMLKETGRGDEAAILMAPAAEKLTENIEVQMTLAVTGNYAADLTSEQLNIYHCRFGQAVMAKVPPNLPKIHDHRNDVVKGNRRLRLGYLSPDLREHSVASFLLPIIENHQRDRIEVFAYSLCHRKDNITERFQAHVEHWIDVAELPDSQLVPRVRRDHLDILIDCGGLFSGGRPFALAQRMAPVQVHYLGYPNTLGLPTVDFRIVDSITDPLGRDADTVESLLRLDGCFLCYQPRHLVSLPKRDPNRPLTFASFNALSKLNPQVIQTWATILQQVPDAKLLLKAGPLTDSNTRDRIRETFAEQGINPERLDLRNHISSHEAHLLAYGDCDIALDPFPYNGTTTTCEALWMGVPVVTLLGNTHPGRVGASLLSAIGQTDWIGKTPQDYIQIACDLAHVPAQLTHIQKTLRAKMSRAPLTDAVQFTRQFETVLLQRITG